MARLGIAMVWLIWLAGQAAGAAAGPGPSAVRTWQAPPRATAPPSVDGVLDDACWREALAITEFRVLGTAAPPAAGEIPATRALLAWDVNALYIGFECREPLAADIVTRVSDHDGPVWSDDSVEVFVDPAGTRQGFVQLAVNSGGVVMDGIQAGLPGSLDRTWDTGVTAACTRDAEGWTAELAIPLAGLPVAAPQADWTFHLARNRRAAGQHLTALRSVINGFGDVARFDVLHGIRLPERSLIVTAVDPGDGFQGVNTARVTLRNLGELEARPVVTLTWTGSGATSPVAEAQATVAPGATSDLALSWERPVGAPEGELVCTVRSGALVVRRCGHRFGPVPEAIGALSPRVFLIEPGSPVSLRVPIRVGAGSRHGLKLAWQAFDGDGALAGHGLTTVRTPDAVVRLFWNRWRAGRYALRFTLSNNTTRLADADTAIRLVMGPWGE